MRHSHHIHPNEIMNADLLSVAVVLSSVLAVIVSFLLVSLEALR